MRSNRLEKDQSADLLVPYGAILEHQDHNKISFEQGLEKKKSEISKRMQEVETVGILLKQQKESLQKRGTRVNNSIDQATDEAHRFAEHCITLIRNHEATIIKELLNHKASFSSEFSSQMSSLDEKVKDVNSSLEFGKDILERNNLPEILNVEETLERRFQDFLTSPEFSRCIVMDNCGVKYEPRDMSNIEKELGKLSFSNTDPSLSIAQGKGLTEGLQGEDCTFTIVTKDWQGQTTYNETDLVNVDIQSMRTGKVIKSIITDVKDGCYEVKFRPEDAGEFRVSITVVGETIKGSPFHLKVLETNKNASSLKKKEKKEFKRERKSGQRGSESLSMIDPSRFDVPAQFMKLLKQVYKTNLQHIEETFNVYIVWEDSASQVCIHPSQTARGKTLYQDGCNAFIDLYQGFHPNVRREVVELPEEANESLIHDAICSLQAEHPVIVEKVENSLVVYAEKEAITRSLRALKKKLSLKQNSGTQKLKRGEENFSRDACEYNEVQQHVRLPFSPQHLNQVLKNGVNLSLYQGDITNEQVDAIVNPANEWLQHGAGVAAAIVRKGGQTIQDESDWLTSKNGPLAVGTATITNSGNLPCRHVIHTVGPRWREHGREKSISLLRQACLESLLIAVKLNFSSIAFTAISSGIFGMPKEICAQVMFDVAEEFSASDDAEFNTLRDVRFVIIDEPTIRSFCEEFDKRFPS